MKFTEPKIQQMLREHIASGEYLSRPMVAKKLGVHRDYVHVLFPEPDKTLRCGAQKVYLYRTDRLNDL